MEKFIGDWEDLKSRYDWPQAFKICNQYREQFPLDSVGYAKSIKSLIEWGKLDQAEELLLKTLTIFPNDPDVEMCKGEISMRRHDWSKANQDWTKFIRKFPNHPTGFVCGIISLRENGKLEEAHILLSEALEIFPNEPGIIAQVGELEMYQKHWNKAIRFWAGYRDRFPNNPTGYSRCISALIHSGNENAADSLLNIGLRLFPDDIGINAHIGEMEMMREEWSKAVQIWAEFRRRYPNSSQGYFRGISALIKCGEIEAAESLIEKGLTLFPNDFGMLAKAGEMAMIRNEWNNAIFIWKVYRQKFSKSPIGYVSGIKSLIHNGHYEQAEKVLKKGIENKIDLKNSYNKIDKTYVKAHDWLGSLKLMFNCDPSIQVDYSWRRKIISTLDSNCSGLAKFQKGHNSYAAINQAMSVVIQIKRWINWKREQTLKKLLYFIEKNQEQYFAKPSLILEEILCENNKVYLRDGILQYTNADDLLILLRELLGNENYWFQSTTSNPIVIDCGTHFGLSLYYYKKLYPQAKIIAFEPNPQLFKIAKENVSRNQWTDITLMPFAISSTSGARKFYIPKNGNTMAGSLLMRLETIGNKFDSIYVQSKQLSKIVNEPIDFLKLDIEGAELEVLKEMKDKLSYIKNIFCEFHEGGEVDSSHLVAAMKILDNSGFKLRIVLSSNFNRLMQRKPLEFLNQRCSSELWGSRIK
jgi:FkbM family methyltransferase